MLPVALILGGMAGGCPKEIFTGDEVATHPDESEILIE
jgi:hypothetical protein